MSHPLIQLVVEVHTLLSQFVGFGLEAFYAGLTRAPCGGFLYGLRLPRGSFMFGGVEPGLQLLVGTAQFLKPCGSLLCLGYQERQGVLDGLVRDLELFRSSSIQAVRSCADSNSV